MTYQVFVTPIADAEAMEAFRWYAERSEASAERWYAGLNKAITSLSNPRILPVPRCRQKIRMLWDAKPAYSSMVVAGVFFASSTRSTEIRCGYFASATVPKAQSIWNESSVDEPETLDVEETIARWDEIMDRTGAGENLIISVDGKPKAK